MAHFTSNMALTLSVMGIRSPLARVKILLSSSTVFRSSIQIASTGPSAMIHVLYAFCLLLNLAHIAANTPAFHQAVDDGEFSLDISTGVPQQMSRPAASPVLGRAEHVHDLYLFIGPIGEACYP